MVVTRSAVVGLELGCLKLETKANKTSGSISGWKYPLNVVL